MQKSKRSQILADRIGDADDRGDVSRRYGHRSLTRKTGRAGITAERGSAGVESVRVGISGLMKGIRRVVIRCVLAYRLA